MMETIQNTLEDQLKEKAEFEDVVDNQLAVIAGLEEQLSAQKLLNNEKIVLLEERVQLIKSKDNCILDVCWLFLIQYLNLIIDFNLNIVFPSCTLV